MIALEPTASDIATRSRGELLRGLYAGSWRPVPPPCTLTVAELVNVLFPVIESGGAGMIWPRLAPNAMRYGAAALALEQAYDRAREAVRERESTLARVIAALQRQGIDPILLKGWGLSRLYPGPAVRPPGDIDLWVPAAQFDVAEAWFRSEGVSLAGGMIDLHDDPHWPDPERVDFRDRAQTMRADGVDLLVPCLEDHLRLLCLHFVGHFMVRPLWLCDIALLLETLPPTFDWDRFHGRNKRRREWILTTLSLAHHLLGARVAHTPNAELLERPLPSWLIPAVLRRWETLGAPPQAVAEELSAFGPREMLRHRWPDPIIVTVQYRAPFRERLVRPLQLGSFGLRIVKYGALTAPRSGAHRLVRFFAR